MEHDDRRKHRRYASELNIKVNGGDDEFHVTTRDVSEGGVFFFTRRPFSLNAIVDLKLYTELHTLEATAVIVHLLPGVGVGVQFEELTEASRLQLRGFLDQVEAEPQIPA